MRIALLGTRGVPARYGGFETAVEEIGAGLSGLGHDVTVYCRSADYDAERYRGMRRVVLPSVHRRTLETLSHAGLSTLHALRVRPDAVVVFNAANAPYVAMLRAARIPTALHIDGHDARRQKWQGLGQRYYSLSTRWGSVIATRVIVDSQAIADELEHSHQIDTVFVPFGARRSGDDSAAVADLIAPLGLQTGAYHLLVARFEPENKVLEILRGYASSKAQSPLVLVGFEGYPGSYAKDIAETAALDARVQMTGPVWNQRLLDALYAGAASYLHGHSVGGTNPSLLRAMAHGVPVLAFDCLYNRETTGGAAMWFNCEQGVAALVEMVECDPSRFACLVQQGCERAAKHYVWSDVVHEYDDLLTEMLTGRPTETRQDRADRSDGSRRLSELVRPDPKAY